MSESDVWSYEDIVRNAAHMVHDGVVNLDDVCVPGYIGENDWEADFSDEEIRDDVEEMLASVKKKKSKQTQTVSGGGYDDIDWEQLWETFGIGTPDAVGFAGASHVQLSTALTCAPQNVNVNPDSAIASAVEDGIIDEVHTDAARGGTVRRGFRLAGGNR